MATVQAAALDSNQTWVYGPALSGCVAGVPCQLYAQLHESLGNAVVRPCPSHVAGHCER